MAPCTDRLAQAEAAYEEALKAHGENAAETLRAAATLGEVHCVAGDPRQALVFLERAGVAQERGSTLEDRALASSLQTVAFLHGLLADADQELSALERAVELEEKLGDKDSLAWSLIRLADLHGRRGDTKKQVALLRRAKDLAADEDLRLLAASRSRASAPPRRTGGRQEDAGTAAERLLALLLGCALAEYAAGRRNLALDLELAQCARAAEGLTDLQRAERAVRAAEQRHGAAGLQVAPWLALLAELHGEKGDYRHKRDILRRVLKIQEQELGFDSVYVSWTLKALAHAEGKLGDLDARCSQLRRALEVQEEELGALHAQTATTRHYLGEAIAERKLRTDPTGSRELSGIFAQKPPMNPKVNRMVGEILYREEKPEINKPAGLAFEPLCTGGGSCFAPEGGIEVPYYFADSVC